ncbi:FABP family protein [Brachybacterium sp. DNPG3]
MPIPLDPSLPASLYPLAWLVGSWSGSGALHRPGDDAGDRRIEQTLECSPREDGTLAWTSTVHVIDRPAPLPPTSAFAKESAPEPVGGSGARSLLMHESGIWTVGDPLPGQDVERARRAKPGSPESIVSYALTASFEASARGELAADAAAADGVWAGEVRGPRIQLAARDAQADGGASAAIAQTRMFGYVAGRLMWLWERHAPGGSFAEDPIPYLSVELDRV